MDDEEKRLRMAVIAGAAWAAKYLEENPKALPQDAVKKITEEAEQIVKKIDDPL